MELFLLVLALVFMVTAVAAYAARRPPRVRVPDYVPLEWTHAYEQQRRGDHRLS